LLQAHPGTEKDGDTKVKCLDCNGTGKEQIPVSAEEIDGMHGPCAYTMLVPVRCHKCRGTGRIKDEEDEEQ